MKIEFFYNDLQKEIVKLLHELGVPAHIKGYQFARDAIEIIYLDESTTDNFKKLIYPVIANKFKTTVYNVERNIRHAIEVSSNRGNCYLLEEIFGYSIDSEKAKPTNSEFLVTIADKIKMDHRKFKL